MEIVIFTSDCRSGFVFEQPATLSDLIAAAGVTFNTPCSGGRCGKCAVYASGELSEPSSSELAVLGDKYYAGMRLACACKALGDCTVTIPARAETEGIVVSIAKTAVDLKFNDLALAVDIGTTTLCLRLCDAVSGEALAQATLVNPQVGFGADVITRIDRAMHGCSAALSDAVSRAVSAAVESMCHMLGVTCECISSAVFTGNTAMLYLLCGFDPTALSRAPFQADRLFDCEIDGSSFGLRAPVYLPPCVSAFVGADAVCAALAVGIDRSEQSVVMTDIGTNGETFISCDGRLVCASAAAGPCFEGVGLSCGMLAADGAINHVFYNNGTVTFETVGDKPAIGLCGSGVIDSFAVMLKSGVLDETGALEGYSWRIADTDVLVTQSDVRAVQLAKSAIRSCIETLSEYCGVPRRALLAGGFGSAIDMASACDIGLLPEYFRSAQAVGNAALDGAVMLMIDSYALKRARWIAQTAEPVDLMNNKTFGDRFIENMMF